MCMKTTNGRQGTRFSRAVLMARSAGALMLALGLGLGGHAYAAAVEVEEFDREELEAKLEAAREQLDEAAHRLAELNGKLYKMETQGSHGKKPMLGVLVDGRAANGGVRVVGITPGGGAEIAGLQAGDVLMTVNDTDLAEAKSAMKALGIAMEGLEAGASVSVGYERDDTLAYADVVPQSRGVYIMKMTGSPGVEIKGLEQLEELEKVAAHLESMDFTKQVEWAENMSQATHVGAVVSGAMSMSGGLRLEQMDSDLAGYFDLEEGVLVVSVPSALKGEESGLKSGDILLAVAGESVSSVGDAYKGLLGEDGSVSVDLLRRGAQLTVDVDSESFGVGSRTIQIHHDETDATTRTFVEDDPT